MFELLGSRVVKCQLYCIALWTRICDISNDEEETALQTLKRSIVELDQYIHDIV